MKQEKTQSLSSGEKTSNFSTIANSSHFLIRLACESLKILKVFRVTHMVHNSLRVFLQITSKRKKTKDMEETE